jgi:flavin-binding protein dodecin
MLPVEVDSDSQSSLDYAIDQAIARLEEQIERLKSLKGSGLEIATVMERVQEVFGERGVIWLIRPNQVLQAIPLDLIRQGNQFEMSQVLAK